MKGSKTRVKGFTLVEMMIVVAIVGLLVAIAIPNWVHARATSQTNACISNLRHIFGATQQWALEYQKAPNATVAFDDIQPYLRNAIVCPAGGSAATFSTSYVLTYVTNFPSCRILPTVHALPPDTSN